MDKNIIKHITQKMKDSEEEDQHERWEMRDFMDGYEGEQKLFYPVATVREIHRFQEQSGFVLPTALAEFYTQVSNGGAGPSSGLMAPAHETEKIVRTDRQSGILDHHLTESLY